VMNSALVIYKNPDSMPAKDAKEVQRLLAANYDYYKAHKDAIVTEVAKETKTDGHANVAPSLLLMQLAK